MAQGCTPPQFHKLLNYRALSKKEAALAYAAIGARVIPLEPESNGPPRVKGWANPAWENPTDPESWWSAHPNDNIGVVTGFGFFVLDFDKKKGGCESYSKLCLLEKLPDTFTVKTRSGGFHVYLTSGEVPLNGVDRLDHVSLPGVDVRSAGGYVAAPGSTVGANGYQIVNSCEMAPAPAWLLDALQPRRGVDTDQTPLVELDTEEAVTLATHWLVHEAPEAIQDSFGDHTTANIVVPKMKDFGISEGLALELLAEHWNSTKAIPPWDPDDLEKKVHSGYKSAKLHAPGIAIAQLPHHEFKPLPQEITDAIERGRRIALEGSRETPKTTLIERWQDVKESSVQWLIKGILPQNSLAALYGKPGSFKSFVALHAAATVAAKQPFLGHTTSTTRPDVLYIAAEGGSGLRRRLDAIEKLHNLQPNVYFIRHPLDFRSSLASVDSVLKATRDLDLNLSLIVVDTLARTFGAGNENSSEDMGAFINIVDHLRATTGAAVLLVHHSGKDVAKGMRGHSALFGAVDAELEVHKLVGPQADGSKPGGGRLRVTKQKDGADDFEVEYAVEVVDLGMGEDLERRTSLAIREWGEDEEAAHPIGEAKMGAEAWKALEVLRERCTASEDGTVSLSNWRRVMLTLGGLSADGWKGARKELKAAGAYSPVGTERVRIGALFIKSDKNE